MRVPSSKLLFELLRSTLDTWLFFNHTVSFVCCGYCLKDMSGLFCVFAASKVFFSKMPGLSLPYLCDIFEDFLLYLREHKLIILNEL